MMDVYLFQAALLCADCGAAMQAACVPGKDSDSYPQGPYPDGGGEADSPQHCDHCRAFLENPLTQEGYRYVLEQVRTHPSTVTDGWLACYGEDYLDGKPLREHLQR
jgi:hypothetical protein